MIRDRYLSMKGYRVAMIPKMKYILVFDIRVDTVFVLGIFHQLENYWIKVSKHHFGAFSGFEEIY